MIVTVICGVRVNRLYRLVEKYNTVDDVLYAPASSQRLAG